MVRARVATGREFIVGSVLILVRAPLIALARSLVVIRPRLVLIARRLIAITSSLVTLTQRTVTRLISRHGREHGSAGLAPQSRRRLAAGWTRHNLCQIPSLAASPRSMRNQSYRLPRVLRSRDGALVG